MGSPFISLWSPKRLPAQLPQHQWQHSWMACPTCTRALFKPAMGMGNGATNHTTILPIMVISGDDWSWNCDKPSRCSSSWVMRAKNEEDDMGFTDMFPCVPNSEDDFLYAVNPMNTSKSRHMIWLTLSQIVLVQDVNGYVCGVNKLKALVMLQNYVLVCSRPY